MTSVDSVEQIETNDVKRIFRQNDQHGYGSMQFTFLVYNVRADKVSCNI